jgi:thiamine pyrophosphate-dependent acetolactate synthase large subunit-like protein
MRLDDCLKLILSRRKDELVITSAGTMSSTWWNVSHDIDATFYLEASMSLASMFGAGLAYALPGRDVWAFNGDGAFCMNPGCLMVENQLGLANLSHFVVSNHCYGSTGKSAIPNPRANDYAGVARAFGIEHTLTFASLAALEEGFAAAVAIRAPKLIVLEVEEPDDKLAGQPLEGPELKFRFGRYIERSCGVNVLRRPLPAPAPGSR